MTQLEEMMTDSVHEQIISQKPIAPDFIIDEWMRTEFTLPQSLKALTTASFLRMWDSRFVKRAIKDGTITHNEVCYQIHWSSLPSICAHSEVLALSFRTYRNKHYVVIKPWNMDRQFTATVDGE